MDGPAEALNIGDPMNSANAIVQNIIFKKIVQTNPPGGATGMVGVRALVL